MALSIEDLNKEVRDVALQISVAEDRKDEREVVLAAHASVERIGNHYREHLATLSEGQKMQVERTLGRRIQDMRRAAAALPRIGVVTGSTPDRRVQGASVAGERHITGVSWGAGRRAVVQTGIKVGVDVEAWCGPCGEMLTHSVVAMIGDDPKQVACSRCNNRHNYRTTPGRKSGELQELPPGEVNYVATSTSSSRNLDRKAEELRVLAKEVALADNVKLFDVKVRYKPGEIIAHPEFGRGKVETVLRASMLVRFASGGLKSVMLT